MKGKDSAFPTFTSWWLHCIVAVCLLTCHHATAESSLRWPWTKDYCKICKSWFDKDKAQGDAWLQALPTCPCTKAAAEAESSTWSKDAGCCKYHPGADECFRSQGALSSGGKGTAQQCCYKDGKLITSGFGAGTPDRGAAPELSWGLLLSPIRALAAADLYRHYVKDVDSFEACCQDCSPCSSTCHLYFERRPPNKGKGCTNTQTTSSKCDLFASISEHPIPNDARRAIEGPDGTGKGTGGSSRVAFRGAGGLSSNDESTGLRPDNVVLASVNEVLEKELNLLQKQI